MQFKPTDKFRVTGADFDVEVIGIYPKGQPRPIAMIGNSYKILMNGIEVDITEKDLEILIKSGKKSELEDVVNPLEVEEKRKPGRSAKVK